jgi:hypothetical protein
MVGRVSFTDIRKHEINGDWTSTAERDISCVTYIVGFVVEEIRFV